MSDALTEEQRALVEARRQAALARRRQKAEEGAQKRKAIEQAMEDEDFEAAAEMIRARGGADDAGGSTQARSRPAAARKAPHSTFLKDTQAGFLLDEEDEENDVGRTDDGAPERERVQLLYEDEPPPEPGQAAHVCLDCRRRFHESQLMKQFGHPVCNACRDMEKQRGGRYALVTKTEAKDEYLLRDIDLDGTGDGLRYIETKNKQHETWGNVYLYLRCQVEERSFARYGGEDGLDAEHERRDEARMAKKQRKHVKEMKRMREETRVVSKISRVKHEHTFGDEVYLEDTDQWKKTCTECNFALVYEKL